MCVHWEYVKKNWSHSYICIFYTLTETNIDISFRAVSSHFSTLGYHTNIHACKKGNWHTDELSTSVCCQMGMRDMIQLWWARCGSVIQFRPPSVYAEWRGADDLPNDQGCGFYSPFIRTYIFIFFLNYNIFWILKPILILAVLSMGSSTFRSHHCAI